MKPRQRYWFCPKCGEKLSYKKLREMTRLVCAGCKYVLYENPVVGVAAIVIKDGKILLGRRAAKTTYPGQWCIPCGYVEYHEDVRDAVKREFLEETGLVIEVGSVFTVHSNWHNPEIHTVGIWFNAQVIAGELCAGDDIDKVEYFPLSAVPQMAFPTDIKVIDTLLALQSNK